MCMYIYFVLKRRGISVYKGMYTKKVLIDLTIHMAYEKKWEMSTGLGKMVRGIRWSNTFKKGNSHIIWKIEPQEY